MSEPDTPLVSISCITYNHEAWIRQALDGFLMQQTDFGFEILVHDDASTDGTADIVRDYEARHPGIVRPIYQDVNQHSQGIRPGPQLNYPRARGRYIALCEGDDYWTDPQKLARQVAYLEAHPAVFLHAHAVRQVDEDGTELTASKFDITEDRYLTQDELAFGRVEFPTLSVMFRNAVRVPRFDLVNGDTFTFSYFSNFGDAFVSREVMGVHRVHGRGIWSSMAPDERLAARLRTWRAIPAVIDPPRRSLAYLRLFQTAREDPRPWHRLRHAAPALLLALAWLRPTSLRFIARRLRRRLGGRCRPA